MPALALFLYGLFVLIVLRLDRKQSREVSFASWIPTIWLLMVFSKPLGIWFGSGAETIEEGSTLDAVFLSALGGSGLILLIRRRFDWSKAMRANPWLIALLGYMLISCLWSDDPFVSFKRWNRELIAIVMALVVASEPHPKQALEILFRRTVYVLAPLSLVLISYFPELGRAYVHHSGDLMWVGATNHKNQLTQLCAFAMFFIIWDFIRRPQASDISYVRQRKYFDIVAFVLALYVMGGPNHTLTYSATSTIAFLLGITTCFGFSWYKKRGRTPGHPLLAGLVVVVLIYGTVTPMIGKLSFIDVSSAVGREENLTGRTHVWRQLIPAAMQRPVLGYGFGGFWTTETRIRFDISGSHNGYLELILQLGFVGLFLYGIFILTSIRKAHALLSYDFYWGALWVCCVFMGLLINITEASFSSFTSKMMAIVLLLTVSSKTPTEDKEPQGRPHSFNAIG